LGSLERCPSGSRMCTASHSSGGQTNLSRPLHNELSHHRFSNLRCTIPRPSLGQIFSGANNSSQCRPPQGILVFSLMVDAQESDLSMGRLHRGRFPEVVAFDRVTSNSTCRDSFFTCPSRSEDVSKYACELGRWLRKRSFAESRPVSDFPFRSRTIGTIGRSYLRLCNHLLLSRYPFRVSTGALSPGRLDACG